MILNRGILIALLLLNSAVLSQTTINIGKVTGSPHSDIQVPVTISAPMNNVKSISLQLSYDNNNVAFNHSAAEMQSGISNFILPESSNLFVSDQGGTISISWFNSTSPAGVTLSGKLFDLDFTFLSEFSEVRFVSAAIKDMQGKKLTFNLSHGSISANTDPAIKLIYPNGGESFQVIGTPPKITWTSVYISGVNLEISTDNGTSWDTITSGYNALNGLYQWTIPNTINSANCKVKISDTASAASDESDAIFTINSTPVVTLLTPNGGEELQTGGVKTIRWNCRNILNVKLEYCTNASAPAPIWQTIAAALPASNSSYEWIIPGTFSTDCKLRITDVDNPATIFDLSDGTLTIHNNPINVSIGNVVDAKVQIIGKVVKADLLPDKFWWWEPSSGWSAENAHYSEDGVEYDATDTLNITGTVPVTVGWLTSIQYLEMYLTFDPNVLIVESLIPAIPEMQPINYSYENGVIHLVWGTDEPLDIHGKIFDLKFRYVKFTDPLQWLDGGWNYFTHPGGDPNTPTASIDPRNFSDLKITKVAAKNSRNNIIDVNNWSDGSLAISDKPAVKLLAPIPGDTLEVNDITYNVLWSSRLVTNVSLSYSTNNGSDWSTIVNSTAAVTEQYPWTLPNVNSTDCLLKIVDASDGSVHDQLPAKFTITNLKSMNLLSPDGGEILKSGAKKNIIWKCRNISSVKIEYSANVDTTWKLITAGVPAKQYKYEWTVPAENSTNCKVRIRDASDSTIADLSTAVFTINSTKTRIKITSSVPSAGNVTVPVNSEQIDEATYFMMSVMYDTAVMQLDNIVTCPALGGGQFNYVNDNGTLRIVWFNTTPVNLSGDLFNLCFKNYTGAVTEIQFDSSNQVKDAFNKVMDIEFVNGILGATDVREENIPVEFALIQNYPNPFNPVTTIRYEIPDESHVSITVFNTLGQKVITLVDEMKKPGFYNVNWDAGNCTSGIYYYSIVTKEFIQTKKMILLK